MPIYEVTLRIEKPYAPDDGMLEEALRSIGVEPGEYEVVATRELGPDAKLAWEAADPDEVG